MPAGGRINVSANCDDPSDRQAIVQSEAFGRLVVMRNEDRIFSSPSQNGGDGILTGSVVIPGSKAAGDYAVTLECNNRNTATTTLTVINMSQPTKGPATGGGGMAGIALGPLILAGGGNNGLTNFHETQYDAPATVPDCSVLGGWKKSTRATAAPIAENIGTRNRPR